jgi:gluconate kinase
MIGPTGPLFGIVWYLLVAPSKDSIYVVFGRAGAGKTTVANLAVETLKSSCTSDNQKNDDDDCAILGLDLDVCVPDWMKENFSNGMYPTLEQRKVFAEECCDYVAKEQESAATASSPSSSSTLSVVSFSFVNTDLRDIFRARFPDAEWFLVDTSPTEANRRIQLREGHFYNQETSDDDDDDDDDDEKEVVDPENNDWNFAPVTFPHVILNGDDSIENSADKIVKMIKEQQEAL